MFPQFVRNRRVFIYFGFQAFTRAIRRRFICTTHRIIELGSFAPVALLNRIRDRKYANYRLRVYIVGYNSADKTLLVRSGRLLESFLKIDRLKNTKFGHLPSAVAISSARRAYPDNSHPLRVCPSTIITRTAIFGEITVAAVREFRRCYPSPSGAEYARQR